MIETLILFSPVILFCGAIYAIGALILHFLQNYPDKKRENYLRRLDNKTPAKYFSCDDPRLFHRPKTKGKPSVDVIYLLGKWELSKTQINDKDIDYHDDGQYSVYPSSNPTVTKSYEFRTDFRVIISICENCINLESKNHLANKKIIANILAEPMLKVFFPSYEYCEPNASRIKIENEPY